MITTPKLPDLGICLTDGGLETSLIYLNGVELRLFSAFELLNNETGRNVLKSYYEPYLRLAEEYGKAFILETPTWRANPDWGEKLGYTRIQLRQINAFAVDFVRGLASEWKLEHLPVLISGNIGPRGDGYVADLKMSEEEAERYHYDQVQTFALRDADLVTAMTINYVEEAMGIVRAARTFRIPAVISFTVETDGKLPTGESLQSAIERTDSATEGYPSHYLINCAHPKHFLHEFEKGGNWVRRIKGIRANASTKSHAELDESTTLDPGDKSVLASGYKRFKTLVPGLKVIGGCCGTDHTHLEQICRTLFNEPVKSKGSSAVPLFRKQANE